MFQKIASGILSACLIFSTITWAEEEKTPFATYVNGEKIEAKDPIWMSHYDVVPYASIARNLGYTVAYHEAENKVISQKDNIVITFVPGENSAHVAEDGGQREQAFGPASCEFDGTVYLSTYSIGLLFDANVSVLPQQREVHVITRGAVTDRIREKTQLLKSLLEQDGWFENYRSDFTVQRNFSGKSDLFGMELEGASDDKVILQKQGKTYYASVKLENSGLCNFKNLKLNDRLISLDGQPATLIGKPAELEFFLNEDGLYVNAGILSMEVVHRYVAPLWYIDPEMIEKCAAFVKDKWILFPFNEEKKQTFSFLFDGQQINYELLTELFTDYFFSPYMRRSYPEIAAEIEELAELWDSKHLSVTDTGGSRTIAYHLDKDMLKTLLKATGNLSYAYQEDTFEEALPLLSFALHFDSVSDKTSRTEQNLSLTLALSNIPNDWSLECGSLQYTISGKNTAIEGAQDIVRPEPSRTVSNSEILDLLNEWLSE